MTFLRFIFGVRVADRCDACGVAWSAGDFGLAGRRPGVPAPERYAISTLVGPAAASASGCCGAGDAVAATRWGVRAGSGRAEAGWCGAVPVPMDQSGQGRHGQGPHGPFCLPLSRGILRCVRLGLGCSPRHVLLTEGESASRGKVASAIVVRPAADLTIGRHSIVPMRPQLLPAIRPVCPLIGLSMHMSQAHESDGGRGLCFAFPGKERTLRAGSCVVCHAGPSS